MNQSVNQAIQILKQENHKLKERIETLEHENAALEGFIRGLSTLFEATRQFTPQDDLLKIIDEILYQALLITQSEHGSVMLVDEETEELVFVMVHGAFREKLEGYRMNWHQGIAGQVVKTGEPLIVNQTRISPYFSSEVDTTFGLFSQKIIAAPLASGSKILGVIELLNKNNGDDYTEADATILSLLGVFAAMSLETIERQLELAEA